jgi:hypothetical protein
MRSTPPALSCVLAAVVALIACNGARDAPAASLRDIELVAHAGFAQPMPAFTLQAPEGWTSEGGAQWNRRISCAQQPGAHQVARGFARWPPGARTNARQRHQRRRMESAIT